MMIPNAHMPGEEMYKLGDTDVQKGVTDLQMRMRIERVTQPLVL